MTSIFHLNRTFCIKKKLFLKKNISLCKRWHPRRLVFPFSHAESFGRVSPWVVRVIKFKMAGRAGSQCPIACFTCLQCIWYKWKRSRDFISQSCLPFWLFWYFSLAEVSDSEATVSHQYLSPELFSLDPF